MSAIKVRLICSALQTKGFVREDGRRHTFFYLIVGGRRTGIHTMISLGEREIGDPLLSQIARQLKLNTHLFADLVDCKMTGSDYVRHLRGTGFPLP